MATLILIRHAKSEWNAKGIWTGLTDIGLSEHAEEQIESLSHTLQGLPIHSLHSSNLKRAKDTLLRLREKLGLGHLQAQAHVELNERDYGIYTGKNKWEVRDVVGETQFRLIRRSWDYAIPDGETLKDVHARVAPFYTQNILPLLMEGKNVLLVAHGNSLRALIKHIEGLSNEEVLTREVGISEAHFYELDDAGVARFTEIRAENTQKGKQ